MAMAGLGRLFDLAPVIVPIDLATGANTGFPVDLSNAGGVTFVLFKDVGTAGQDPVLTVREAQDGSGTSEQDLDVVTEYFYKGDASLSGNETWTRVTQTAGDIDLDGSLDAEEAGLVAFYVDADSLSEDYTHVTVDIADTGATAGDLGSVLAILHDLHVQRRPDALAASQ